MRRTARRIRETFGAGSGTRTRDIKLGKLALYQLSYARSTFSFERVQSNRRREAGSRGAPAGGSSGVCLRGAGEVPEPEPRRAILGIMHSPSRTRDGLDRPDSLYFSLTRRSRPRRRAISCATVRSNSGPGSSLICSAMPNGTTSGPSSAARRSRRSSPTSSSPRTSATPGAGCSRSKRTSAEQAGEKAHLPRLGLKTPGCRRKRPCGATSTGPTGRQSPAQG